MIERVVLIELRPEYRGAEDLATIAAQTRQVLASIPDVRALRVGTAADDRTAGAWQLCIEVQCDDLEAVERYRAHKAHRAYVDVFLRPMMASIRVYNFESID
ncbi:MAG: Dabb family protein [Myxococcota bacterium]